jgi:hypothetical protein
MPTTFQEHALRVQEHLEGFYRIRILTTDILDPLIGDLDGAEIHIDYAVTPEERPDQSHLCSAKVRRSGIAPIHDGRRERLHIRGDQGVLN